MPQTPKTNPVSRNGTKLTAEERTTNTAQGLTNRSISSSGEYHVLSTICYHLCQQKQLLVYI
jgi:hypothetical protein